MQRIGSEIELDWEFQIQDGKETTSSCNCVVWVFLEFAVGIDGIG
jgi:hypothetical protein